MKLPITTEDLKLADSYHDGRLLAIMLKAQKVVFTAHAPKTYPCYNGKRGRMKFRNPRSIGEMIVHCTRNLHIWFLTINGDARQAKVNGRVRTWKRDPDRVEIPIKYGMYEYGILTGQDLARVLIRV